MWVLFFLLAFFIMAEGYRGNLISFLMKPAFEAPIDDLKGAVEAPQPIRSLSNIAKQVFSLCPLIGVMLAQCSIWTLFS